MTRIGVTLSGGGHRACLFALGVLLYLADAGRQQVQGVLEALQLRGVAQPRQLHA